MLGFLCSVLGHKDEAEWVAQYSPALGSAWVEMNVCRRCGRKTPTGRDSPVKP